MAFSIFYQRRAFRFKMSKASCFIMFRYNTERERMSEILQNNSKLTIGVRRFARKQKKLLVFLNCGWSRLLAAKNKKNHFLISRPFNRFSLFPFPLWCQHVTPLIYLSFIFFSSYLGWNFAHHHVILNWYHFCLIWSMPRKHQRNGIVVIFRFARVNFLKSDGWMDSDLI